MKAIRSNRWGWVLTAVLLTALLGSLAACGAAPQQAASPSTAQGQRPVVKYFSATASTISSGQATELRWDVSGPATVVIDQGIGAVSSTGTQQVSPSTTTTYTLTATDGAVSAISSLTITVTPAVTAFPDLVVTEIPAPFSSVVSYKIKNVGTATAQGSWSDLYVNNEKVASDHIEPLAPGEERVESFSTYRTNLIGAAETSENPTKAVVTDLRICADAKNEATESNENNNCMEATWGIHLTYSFVENAEFAEWDNGTKKLDWPMSNLDDKGAAFFNHSLLEDGKSYADGLAMYPKHVSQGIIRGTFGHAEHKDPIHITLNEVTIPADTTFTAMLGFAKGAEAPEGATATFAVVDLNSRDKIYSQTIDVYDDGKLDPFVVDLSDLAGKKAYFVLEVEAKGDGTKDYVVWVQPMVVQGQPK